MALEITIDRELCMGSGNCSFWAPGVFDLDDEGIAVVLDADRAAREKIVLAAQGCPTQAIASSRTARSSSERADLTSASRRRATMRRMPIGHHRRARRAAPRGSPLRRHAHPARRDARGARRRDARRVPDVLGRARASRAGSACTSPRRTAARATASSSRRWCSRSSGGRARPVRTSPTVLAAAVLEDAGGPGGRRSCCRSSRAGELHRRGRAERPDDRSLGGALADVVVRRAMRRRLVRARREHAVGRDELQERRPRPAGSRQLDLGGAHAAGGSPPRRSTRERVRDLAAVLLAAEAIGVAEWCVDTAAEYAKVRVQFGRPIGQFQGVKHRCADMLARTELARAAVWDAARAVRDDRQRRRRRDRGGGRARVRRRVPQRQGLRADARRHRLHVGARRAPLPAPRDDVAPARRHARRVARRCARRSAAWRGAAGGSSVDLGPRPRRYRAELRAFLAEITGPRRRASSAPGSPTRATSRRAGRGRGAATPTALELLVIEEEFRAAKVARPGIIGVGAWALPNLIVYGTRRAAGALDPADAARRDHLVPAVQRAGRGFRPRVARRRRRRAVDGGWVLNGQKVWTSMAQASRVGHLPRAHRSRQAEARRHLVLHGRHEDARASTSGRCASSPGMAMFNEVFFDDVFVPDDCLVGAGERRLALRAHDARQRARRTWAAATRSAAVSSACCARSKRRACADDRLALDEAGDLVVTGHALAVLGFRMTLQALAGADPSGSEAAVRKLLGVQHDQRVQEVGMLLDGRRRGGRRGRRGRVGRRRSCSTGA